MQIYFAFCTSKLKFRAQNKEKNRTEDNQVTILRESVNV